MLTFKGEKEEHNRAINPIKFVGEGNEHQEVVPFQSQLDNIYRELNNLDFSKLNTLVELELVCAGVQEKKLKNYFERDKGWVTLNTFPDDYVERLYGDFDGTSLQRSADLYAYSLYACADFTLRKNFTHLNRVLSLVGSADLPTKYFGGIAWNVALLHLHKNELSLRSTESRRLREARKAITAKYPEFLRDLRLRVTNGNIVTQDGVESMLLGLAACRLLMQPDQDVNLSGDLEVLEAIRVCMSYYEENIDTVGVSIALPLVPAIKVLLAEKVNVDFGSSKYSLDFRKDVVLKSTQPIPDTKEYA